MKSERGRGWSGISAGWEGARDLLGMKGTPSEQDHQSHGGRRQAAPVHSIGLQPDDGKDFSNDPNRESVSGRKQRLYTVILSSHSCPPGVLGTLTLMVWFIGSQTMMCCYI